MNDSVLRKLQVAASFALILSGPAVVSAAHQSFDDSTGKLRVSYSDLDLSSDAGVTVLYGRLQQASELACDTGSLHQKGSLQAARQAEACYEEVLTNLVSKVDNDRLTAIHEG